MLIVRIYFPFSKNWAFKLLRKHRFMTELLIVLGLLRNPVENLQGHNTSAACYYFANVAHDTHFLAAVIDLHILSDCHQLGLSSHII